MVWIALVGIWLVFCGFVVALCRISARADQQTETALANQGRLLSKVIPINRARLRPQARAAVRPELRGWTDSHFV